MSNTFADKSGRGLLLAALNKAAAEKGVTFKQTDLLFGAVEESTNPAREVQMTYSAAPDTQFEGEAVAFYNKIDLTSLFENAAIEVVQISAGPTTLAEVVAAVNARYSLGFTSDDIVTEGDFEAEASTVVLVAAEGSYGFKGQVIVEVVEGKLPLAEVIGDPVLGDLVVPVEIPAYLTAPVIIVGEITAKGRTASNKMIVGTGNPVTEMTLASNGEIEVGLGARIWKGTTPPASQDGHYDIAIKDNGDWNWPFSIALLQEERPISELYDVTLTVTSLESGISLPFYLNIDSDGVAHFLNTEYGIDIVDSSVTSGGSVVQNIQRITFYKPVMGEMTTNAGGAPIGDFMLSLRAERREGLVEAVVAEITVNVTVEEPA